MYKKVKIFEQYPVLLFVLFAFLFGSAQLAAKDNKNAINPIISHSAKANKHVAEKLELAKMNQKFLEGVQAKIEAYRQDEVFQQKMRNYSPGAKIKAFLETIDRAKVQGIDTVDLLRTGQKRVRLNAAAGSISGTVTVNGAAPPAVIEVMAFDAHGFFAASTSTNFDGTYMIADLSAGDYFIVTSSTFVDEFYNDVMLDFFENWRDADLVTVQDGQTATGIDFDLQRGAEISGTIFQADGVTPLPFISVDFQIVSTTNPNIVFETNVPTSGMGTYVLTVPATGSFNITAETIGFGSDTQVVEVHSLTESIPNINFSLSEGGPMAEGGVIQGQILGPGDAGVGLALVFTFDVADTTISGFTIADFSGGYQVTGLNAGSHVVYAKPLLNFLFEQPGLQGEYYLDAKTSAEATPVIVTENGTTPDINFALEAGGEIAGNISSATGSALDSVFVIAVKKFDISSIGGFLTDAIDLGFGISDLDGNYSVTGLSSGDYIVRTISLINFDTGLVAADHVDEYYGGVQSIWDFEQATPVTVNSPETTSGIDFALELGGAIRGHFFEADGSTPVDGDATAVVFNAETGLPEIAIPAFNSEDGSYSVGPLPTGTYNVLGTVDSNIEGVVYLPQFYNGKASLDNADDVSVTAPNVTDNINFTTIRGGSVLGFVNITNEFPAGADSLSETLVLAYDANSGQLLGGSDITFAGGYRIEGLPPGQYKVAALPAANGRAATYHGGGASFNDPNSAVVTVGSDATATADIDLAVGQGIISGTIYNQDGSKPLDGVLVIAYDATGHAISAGISGFTGVSGGASDPGKYFIPGLVAGNYYVRTFAFFQLFAVLENLGGLGGDLGGDPLSIIFALLGSSDLFGNLSIDLYGDLWYSNTPVELNLGGIEDLLPLLFNILLSGDVQFILPFFDTVPAGAQQVAVTSPGLTGNIDFMLPSFDFTTDVSENPISKIPSAFQLSQNYPNPFNPTTVIDYKVPRAAQVSLKIYNMLGQQIRTLFDGAQEPGSYSMQWNGLNERGEQVAAGIYFIRMEVDNLTLTRKMLLVK